MNDEKYWIAINGAACALASLPMRDPKTTPTAQQMLGFLTLEEAKHAQHLCLYAPMDAVREFFESLRPDVKSGRIRVIQPKHPQPNKDGPMLRTESAVCMRSYRKISSRRRPTERRTHACQVEGIAAIFIAGFHG
jgi:hypothetical protein